MKQVYFRFICMMILLNRWCMAASSDSLHTVYSHGLNTDSWLGSVNFKKQLSSKSQVIILEKATSSRLQGGGSRENKWKDQHDLKLQSNYNISTALRFSFLGAHYLFSDKQSGYENDIHAQKIALGGTYLHNRFSVPVLFGVIRDQRLNQTDTGFNMALGLDVPDFKLQEYTHQLQTRIDHDHFPERKNQTQTLNYQIRRLFYEDTADTLNIQYQRLRRDYYITPEGTIESRVENASHIMNRLRYRIGERSHMILTGRLSFHRLNISLLNSAFEGTRRDRKDFTLYGDLQIKWERSWMTGRFHASHLSEDQKYQLNEPEISTSYFRNTWLRTPDNRNNLTSYDLRTDFPLGFSDTLQVNTQFQKRQYDTPDKENFDDRDEIRWHIDLTQSHSFSSDLTLDTELSMHLVHLVYIFGEKSADNNWTRIIRLAPVMKWKPNPDFIWQQSVAVLANYVDYDFDTQFTGVRSFLFRKFQITDSVKVGIKPGARMLIHYKLELDENGKLIWDQWLEQKLIDRQSHYLTVQFEFYPLDQLQLRPGYAFFSRRGYRYDVLPDGSQQKVPHLDFQSHGPLLKWAYTGRRLSLIFSAQTIRTRTLTANRQIYTKLDFDMVWKL
jgi:hypothetical protein